MLKAPINSRVIWASDQAPATACEPLSQVAELKTKLDAAEKVLGTLEKERQPSLRESGARSDQTWEKLREEVGGARGAPPRPQERAGLRLQTVENRPFIQIYCLPGRTDVQGCTGCASPPSQK